MASRRNKRPLEVIDLTGDDVLHVQRDARNARPCKQPRTSRQHQVARTPAVHMADEDETEGASEAPGLSQDYMDHTSSEDLYGILKGKIVGCRYYSGIATYGEQVLIRREPNNKYDRNATRALNGSGDQIGHLPREVASKLAKYMDNHSLRVEGSIAGRKGAFECAIQLLFYGSSDQAIRHMIETQMRADGLPVNAQEAIENGQVRQIERKQALSKLRAEDSQVGQFVGGPVGGSLNPKVDEPTLESIVEGSQKFNPRNAERMTEQSGSLEKDLENMPKATQPDSLNITLLPYQLQGLHWLLEKESPQLPKRNKDVVQLWTPSTVQAGAYTNLATNYTQKNPPTLASGGILADDMGLGKTVQMIALMMADRESNPSSPQPTLILSPLSVMSNWSGQIKRHIKDESALRVLTYHGANKKSIDSTALKGYDVVITTYETVSSEFWSLPSKQKVPSKKGLFSVTWRRLILDEGHNIRNPAAKRSIAAFNLVADSRWVLTGTPIVNSLKDLYSLVRFLRLSGGVTEYELFNSCIIRPVIRGITAGGKILQALMRGICLRRKKDMPFVDLRLPELSEFIHHIEFKPHELEKYQALEAEAKGRLETYRNQSTSGRGDGGKAYRHLLEILLRLRQVCNHWKLCGEERFKDIMDALDQQKTVDLTPENMAALQEMLGLSIESQDDCPICLDILRDPVITCCTHVFCGSCIERVIETQAKCPMCRAELPDTATTLVRPGMEASSKTKTEIPSINDPSSKVEALLSILKASNAQSSQSSQATQPSSSQTRNKTVVFSQWTSFLDIVQQKLEEEGINYTRIDGSMSAILRDQAMEKLENDSDCTVLLASLGVCSVGLNLVAANQVVMADTWWAPAIEDQAVDRVHRLGQKKPTRVFRLVMKDSIEDNVIRIQQDKRKLMSFALSDKDGSKGGRGGRTRGARLGDIERLLGGGSGNTDGGVNTSTEQDSAQN